MRTADAIDGPLQCREQAGLRDVAGGDANAAVQPGQHRAVGRFDAHAILAGPLAAGATVDGATIIRESGGAGPSRRSAAAAK